MTAAELQKKDSLKVLEKSVKGMLPKNRLELLSLRTFIYMKELSTNMKLNSLKQLMLTNLNN
jgi:ribosomal protein L13